MLRRTPSLPSGSPDEPPQDSRPTTGWWGHAAYAAAFAGGIGWTASLMARSPGTPSQDEITHVLIAKHAWNDPWLLLDAWGRPGNTVSFLVPARFGLTGARIGAIVLSALTVLVATKIAQQLGVGRLYLIPLFLWFQPWFHDFGYLALTEIPFSLFLAGSLAAWLGKRYGWAALAFGILPLIRWEALALLPLAGIPLLVTRRWRLLPVLGAPLILYLALVAVASESVQNVFGYLSTTRGAYGYGTWGHFFGATAPLVGAPVLAMGALGLPSLRSSRVAAAVAVWVAYFILQVVTWRRGLGAGYVEFVLPVAPAFALMSAFGAERISTALSRTRALVAVRGVVLVVVTVSVLALAFQSDPRPLDPEATAMKEAATWLRESGIEAPAVISTHPWFEYFYGSPFTPIHEGLPDGGRHLPAGTIMAWDRHYSDRLGYLLSDLEDPAIGWTRIATFGAGRAVIFRKQ